MENTTAAPTTTEPTQQATEQQPETLGLFVEESDAPPAPQATASPEEKPAEPSAPTVEPPSKISREWASLTRKQREMLQREQQIKAAEQEILRYRQLQESAKSDPMKLLETFGLPVEAIIDKYIEANAGPQKPGQSDAAYKREMDEMKSRLDKTHHELEQYKFSQMQQQEYGHIASVIRDLGEECEIVSRKAQTNPGIVDYIFNEGATYYKMTGKIPDYKEFVRALEQQESEALMGELAQLANLKTVQKKYKLVSVDQAPQPAQKPQATAPTRTLTNTLASEQAREQRRAQTDDERYAEAMDILKGVWTNE